MRYILTRSGYTVQEFTEHLQRRGGKIKTTRSVYRLMLRAEVPTRYVALLEELIGAAYFRLLVGEIIRREERRTAERAMR